MRSSDVLVEKAKFLLLKSMPVLNEEYSPKQNFFSPLQLPNTVLKYIKADQICSSNLKKKNMGQLRVNCH